MCGFFSVFSPSSNLSYSKKRLNMAADLIKHRGPDKTEIFSNSYLFCKFFRLKILDLSNRAMQPMIDLNKRYLLLFNEAYLRYAFKEL